MAVGYVEGQTDFVLSLNEDASGIPGKALKTWKVSNLTNDFGDCGEIDKINITDGKKGGRTRYESRN